MRGRTLALAAGLAAALPAWPGSVAADRALVIGINDYPHYPSHRQLVAAVPDALAVRDFLVHDAAFRAEDILLLTDAAASRQAILEAIETWLVAGTQPGDRVVFYFSGHGSQVPDLDGDDGDGTDESLVASDARPGDDSAGHLVDDEIRALFGGLAGRRVVVLVDSCHSGTVTRAAGLPSNAPVSARPRGLLPTPAGARPLTLTGPPALPDGPVTEPFITDGEDSHLQVFTAAAPHQYSWETETGGVVTRLFLEGLADRRADANGNGVVTTLELTDHLRQGADAWCQSNPDCRREGRGFTPMFRGRAVAMDEVLTRASGAPPAPAPEGLTPDQPVPDQPAPDETAPDETAADQPVPDQPVNPPAGFAAGTGSGSAIAMAAPPDAAEPATTVPSDEEVPDGGTLTGEAETVGPAVLPGTTPSQTPNADLAGAAPTAIAVATPAPLNIAAAPQAPTAPSTADAAPLPGTMAPGPPGPMASGSGPPLVAEDLFSIGNDAAVAIRIDPGPQVRVGQPVRFTVTSDRAGHLVLLDLNAAGQLTQLFPNRLAAGHRGMVQAGRPLTVPEDSYGFGFQATEPLGQGRLIALVVEQSVPLGPLLAPHSELTPIEDGRAWLSELAVRLRRETGVAGLPQAPRWSAAYHDYWILPGQ